MQYLAGLLGMVCDIYVWIIVIRALISWFSPDPYNPLYRMLINITEPVLSPFRKVLPSFGGLDLSPIIVILIISYVIKGMVLPFIAGL
ncbi:MAG: YggT family protein [Candidatus Cloacimonadales bacterium]|nr:YggT family protein [Candidatus Cloacimonadota bacterium]MDD2651076.1 YggT family protein [Candidatus Cloacimonadota bacterium]MDX9977842.1 YggT family protein [Candidatus Cloacimonadales bacterium]